MEKQIKEMVIIPEGAPYGMHIVYHYDDEFYSPRGFRTVFTREQVAALEAEFQQTKYVTGVKKKQLAGRLGIQEKQVKDWFQNRRSKARREGECLNEVKQLQQQNHQLQQQQQQQQTPDNDEGICNILEFLQDQDNAEIRLNHSTWDLDETLEVLKKHSEKILFEENTPSPIKRKRCEIVDEEEPPKDQRLVVEEYQTAKSLGLEFLEDYQSSKRQRLEILEHQIYDPATGIWRRVA